MPAITALALLAVYYLATTWRKWPDPIADSGPQWYAFWRLSRGAVLYHHDMLWNYGPLSAYLNAALFKCLGPGMMVLVGANLVVWGLFTALAYAAFRLAWGRLAAFAAAAVFISVFSFSSLNGTGNYNFATPYSHESTHGMLLLLMTAFVAVRWCAKPARWPAFLLGLCGGLSAVLKPEFMLAAGILGIAMWILRWMQKKPVGVVEHLLLAAGVVLPTMLFTLGFAAMESWTAAFEDASEAWWVLIATPVLRGSTLQASFTGLDHPWGNGLIELNATLYALVIVGAIWAAGWITNRPCSPAVRVAMALGSVALVCSFNAAGAWQHAGKCFPGLVIVVAALVMVRMARQLRQTRTIEERTLMAFALIILAGAMLARMPLRARVDHFGFFQAALAGMVIAAALVSEIPLWTGANIAGQRVAAVGCLLVLAVLCGSITLRSQEINKERTQAVAAGSDRFYAFNQMVDPTGALVSWTVERMKLAPPGATLLVLPEGVMINYLTRRISPVPPISWQVQEPEFLEEIKQHPPDYVALLSRDLGEYDVRQFGAPGNAGDTVMKWVMENYVTEALLGKDPLSAAGAKGAVIYRRTDPNANPPH